MKSTINIGLLGYGNVGTMVYDLICKNAAVLQPKTVHPLDIKKIAVRDANKRRIADAGLFTTDIKSIVTDPEIDIVVELMGDCPEALEAMKLALSHGKHVVTANKAAIAKHGVELFGLAREKNLKILYEASVAGGIPILRAIREGLPANRIDWLRGIINGTSNYILSEMAEKNLPFESVLKKAQELGYAESDPASDVEGIDAAYKLCILIMLCYGVWVPVEKIYRQGITQISALDISMARQFDFAIKLMGITKSHGDDVEARVHPVMVPRSNPIAHVGGVFNAIQYHGDYVGVGMFYGRGAGGGPTASAVVSDILEVCRSLERDERTHSSPTGFPLKSLKTVEPVPMGDLVCQYYLRFTVIDKPNVLAQLTAILGQHQISIQNLYQHGDSEERHEVPVIAFTHRAKEKDIRKALDAIDKLDSVTKPSLLIRIEED